MKKKYKPSQPYSHIDITLNDLKKYLNYDPISGYFSRKISRGKWKAGEIVGCIDKEGYRIINVNYRDYRASRLAWFYMTGFWPKNQIDHKDRNTDNNSWGNLREATNTENSINQKKKKIRYNLPKGVWIQKNKHSIKFTAGLSGSKGYIHLGTFNTPQEAAIAYDVAAIEKYGEFACTNKSLGLI